MPFSALGVEFEVHIVSSNIGYTDVPDEALGLMDKCTILPSPLLVHIDIERPCVSQATNRYIYVVMVLISASSSTMGIRELRVYSSKYCRKKLYFFWFEVSYAVVEETKTSTTNREKLKI